MAIQSAEHWDDKATQATDAARKASSISLRLAFLEMAKHYGEVAAQTRSLTGQTEARMLDGSSPLSRAAQENVASRFVSNGSTLPSDVHDTARRTMAEDGGRRPINGRSHA